LNMTGLGTSHSCRDAPDYVALKPNHGEVLHDHIHKHHLSLARAIFEGEACARTHAETVSKTFVGYMPDSGKVNAVLAGAANEPLL
jgi:hypothetical protein